MSDLEGYVADFSRHTEELRARLRLPAVSAPGNELAFPEDLSSLSPPALARHLTYWAAIASYAKTKSAVLDGAALLARTEYEREVDVRFTSYAETESKATLLKHRVGASRSVLNLKGRARQLEADAIVFRALVESYELRYAAVSRELTRRQTER